MAKRITKKAREGAVAGGLAVPQVEHVSKSPCSVELSRDAKGQARWSIKIYAELDEMDFALDEVLRLDGRLREGKAR